MFAQGYIGITKYGRHTRRLWEHKNVSQNKHLKHALDKYDVVMDIILIADEDYCKVTERNIRPFANIGWNIEAGGSLPPSFKGKKRSAEFVEKAKQRKDSAETRVKKSLSSIGNKRGLGSTRNAEQRAAISAWMKGKQQCLGKQNGLKYRYIGTNIATDEQVSLRGGKDVTAAGFHYGHVSQCANGSQKSHKGFTWIKEPI